MGCPYQNFIQTELSLRLLLDESLCWWIEVEYFKSVSRHVVAQANAEDLRWSLGVWHETGSSLVCRFGEIESSQTVYNSPN